MKLVRSCDHLLVAVIVVQFNEVRFEVLEGDAFPVMVCVDLVEGVVSSTGLNITVSSVDGALSATGKLPIKH